MNKPLTAGWIAAVTALVTVFAAHGKSLVEAGMAAWLFLLKLSEGAPLGLSSFLLALALAVAAQPFLRRYLPDLRCPLSRDFLIDSSALVIGVGVMWGQMRSLDALLLGLLAGFSAPWVFRGMAASAGLLRRPLTRQPAGRQGEQA